MVIQGSSDSDRTKGADAGLSWGGVTRSDLDVDYQVLRSLRNRYSGRRCFVVGNGPSLRAKDLNIIDANGDVTIATNKIFLIFSQTAWRPTFYMLEDSATAEVSKASLDENFCGNVIYADYLEPHIPPSSRFAAFKLTGRVPPPEHPGFSPNFAVCAVSGGTITYSALQLAYWLGVSEVYFLGVDFNYALPDLRPSENYAGFKPFSGTNLLLFKLEQLKAVSEIDRIVVTSDSDHMLQMAKDAGVETHKRGLEYCDEKTKSFGEVVRHVAESVSGDHILWATCTAPLVFPKLYRQAIREYASALSEGFDSLMSVEVFKRYVWDATGPVNYKLGINHVPSQQLPEYFFITDGVLLAPRTKMIEWSYFHGTNPYKFRIGKREAVDIDDGLDLAKARAWLDMDESVSQISPYIHY